MEKFSERKKLRLENYNYNNYGAYFLTICTVNKEHILGNEDDYRKKGGILKTIR